MKLRRLFALLMAALMLLGMIPAAQAQEIWCPDLGMEHDWSTPEYDYGTCEWGFKYCKRCGAGSEVPPRHNWVTRTTLEPGCETPGYKESICSSCNSEQGNPQEIPALGHNWGSWRWVHGEPPCNSNGAWQVRDCQRCGQQEDRWVEGGAHSFGPWETTQEATCMAPGRRAHTCTLCGHFEWAAIQQLDHVFGEWHVVQAAQIGVPGLEQRDCTYGCGTNEQRQIPPLDPNGTATGSISGLNVYKKLIDRPADETVGFVAGEQISYMITVENKTGADLFNLEISDPLRSGNPVIATYPKMPADEGVTVHFYYIITDADVANGSIVNTAYASAKTAGGLPVNGTSNTVTTPVGTKSGANDFIVGTIIPTESEDPVAGLDIRMEDTLTPANGAYYVPDEWIEYRYNYGNTGDVDLMNGAVYAPTVHSGGHWTVVPSLPANTGTRERGLLRHRVTEQDAINGSIDLYVYIVAYDADGNEYTATSNIVTAPCGSGEPANVPGLTVDMTYTNTPANGSFFTPGEVIDYLITVTNTGDVPLKNLQVGNSSSEAVVPAPSEIAPGQTIQVPYYKLVYEGDAKSGGISSYGHANAFNGDPALPESLVSGRSADVFVPCGMGDGTPSVYYLKIVANAPANGLYFTEGETIKYRLSFGNNTKKDIYNITLNDPMANTRSVAFARRLKAGEFLMGEFEHVVTAADVAAGQIVNTATSTWATKAEGALNTTSSNTVVTPTVSANPITPSAQLSKSIKNSPANGLYFVPGEEIQFSVTVQNTMDQTLDVVVLTDPLSSSFYHELLDIPGGAMDSRDLSYTVTELDAVFGSVANCAYAVVYMDGASNSLTSNTVSAPCGFPEGEDPFGVLTGLNITKAVESLPLNGSYYTEGETVAYKITYANSGELPLTDVMIYDAMGGMSEIATAETLTPGESRVCWFNHTVTADDVARGYISNTAIGQFELNGCVTSVSSNTVTVDTNGKQDIGSVHPFWPGDDYDPGTGWLPGEDPSAEGWMPPFGTIDTDTLRSEDAYCVRTITSRDNASVSYETSFCAGHADTQASILAMNQVGKTPEMQMQAATYAVALWRSEVEKLYQEIFTAADPMAKATVMAEYIRFLTEVANYEALLKNLHPDQPALAAKKIAAMWEDKCVTLCYEMHATAAQRKDSLLSVTPAAGAAASECDCATTDEVNGKKTYTQSYCPVHGFPFSMIDILLQGQDTAEAWTMVRQIWSVELSNAYNKASAKLGANSALALAEYNALIQWMMAREASLIALYPENPEVVVQTMVKLIMDRVNDLCQVTK